MPHVQTTGFKPAFPSLSGEDSHRSLRLVQKSLRDGIADALDLDARGRGLQGLAAAIRDKISGAGPDAVPSMLETIDRALDDAAGKLAAQGVSQEQIDAGVARFRNRLAREIEALAGGDATPKPPAADVNKTAIAARQDVRERFSMDILTAEGDRVSIRFKAMNVTEVAAAQVTRDGATATVAEANVISRGRFKLEVHGNLNEAEKAAIGNLLEKVDGVAKDFFGGDVEAAFAAASRVGLESDALAAFDVRMSYSKKVAVAAYASNSKLGNDGVPAPAAPAPTSSAAAPVKQQPEVAPASAVAAAPPVEPATTPASTELPAPVSNVVPTSAAVALDTAKSKSAIETITKFAKDVLERLDERNESDAAKFSLRWKVEFMMKAFGSVALTETEKAAANALGATLDAPRAELI